MGGRNLVVKFSATTSEVPVRAVPELIHLVTAVVGNSLSTWILNLVAVSWWCLLTLHISSIKFGSSYYSVLRVVSSYLLPVVQLLVINLDEYPGTYKYLGTKKKVCGPGTSIVTRDRKLEKWDLWRLYLVGTTKLASTATTVLY